MRCPRELVWLFIHDFYSRWFSCVYVLVPNIGDQQEAMICNVLGRDPRQGSIQKVRVYFVMDSEVLLLLQVCFVYFSSASPFLI